MNDSIKNKLNISPKARLVIASAIIAGVLGSASAVWYHYHKKSENFAAASVSDAPSIQSIPGAGNPSAQYVAQQNLENNLQAEAARKNASSAVPTLTRPEFIGNPNDLGDVVSNANSDHFAANIDHPIMNHDFSAVNNDLSAQSNACPIKKTVVLFKPNPANCGIENLQKAREAGVTAEELACQSCSLEALRAAGYTAGDLKNVGYSAGQLKKAGYHLGQLEAAGFSPTALREAGYSARRLANAGLSAGQLSAAGYAPSAIGDAGFNTAELEKAGISDSSPLKKLVQAKAQGVSAAALKQRGVSGTELGLAGYPAQQLKEAGYSVDQVKGAGFGADALKKAGYSAGDLKKADFSAPRLKEAGFSNSALKSAGFSPAEIAFADEAVKACNLSQLKKARETGVSVTELRKKGCGLAALKAAGFTASELKKAGLNAAQLKQIGFSADALKAAGFSPDQLEKAGFDPSQLKALGYSPDALKNAGFGATSLKEAGFSAPDLRGAGFSCKQLKDAGFSAAALKNAGYSAAQLKNAGFGAGELADAGFSAKELHAAGLSAKQLRDAGFNAARLKNAGYSAKALKEAGYSDGDLLRAGFKPLAEVTSVAGSPGVVPSQSVIKNPAAEINAQMNADPGNNAREKQLAAMVRASNARISAQARADAIAQMQGAMTMQANHMLTEWSHNGTQTYQAAAPVKKQTENTQDSAGSAEAHEKIMKAGSVMFAVLDTSVNTDERSPIMARIVDGPLKGAKLLGRFKRVHERVLLSFDLLNDPHYYKSIPIDAVAIDPDTARTAISGQVNNHYLLKYGVTFAAAFVSGLSNAIMDSGSSSVCFLGGCVNNTPKLSIGQQLAVGLGTAGDKIADNFASKFGDIPPTIKIKGGTGVGILLMSDLSVPDSHNEHLNGVKNNG